MRIIIRSTWLTRLALDLKRTILRREVPTDLTACVNKYLHPPLRHSAGAIHLHRVPARQLRFLDLALYITENHPLYTRSSTNIPNDRSPSYSVPSSFSESMMVSTSWNPQAGAELRFKNALQSIKGLTQKATELAPGSNPTREKEFLLNARRYQGWALPHQSSRVKRLIISRYPSLSKRCHCTSCDRERLFSYIHLEILVWKNWWYRRWCSSGICPPHSHPWPCNHLTVF